MSHLRNTLLFCCVLWAAATAMCLAAPKETPLSVNPPPMAQPANLSLYRGESIVVPLHASGRTPGQVKFLLRSKPANGTLGEIRITGRTTATVIYTHNDNIGASADEFTYAVQTIDSPVSARARIQLTISEAPAELAVVARQKFDRVVLGQSTEEEITLQNTGGGVLSGTLLAPPPWKIIGSSAYSLGRGEKQQIRIRFTPKEEREYTGRLTFSHDARLGVMLNGEAFAPLSFQPTQELALKSGGGTLVQSGTLKIQNRTDTDRIITVTAPAEIEVEKTLTIPGKSEVDLTLQTKPDFMSAMEGSIQIASEQYAHEIPLRVFAGPAVLSVEPSGGFSYGTIEQGKEYEKFLTIKNAGGSEARVKATLPTGLTSAPDLDGSILTPGESRTYQILLKPRTSGEYSEKIQIETGSMAPFPLSVKANIQKSIPKNNRPIISTPSATLASVPSLTVMDLPSNPDQEANTLQLPHLEALKVRPGELEITWQKPSNSNIQRYVVEGRTLKPSVNGPPQMIWNEWTRVQFRDSPDGKNVIARFTNLPSNGSWYIRITSIDAMDQRSHSSVIRIGTPPAPPNHLVEFFVIVLLLVGAGFTIRHYRHNQKKNAQHDAERMAKLEKP